MVGVEATAGRSSSLCAVCVDLWTGAVSVFLLPCGCCAGGAPAAALAAREPAALLVVAECLVCAAVVGLDLNGAAALACDAVVAVAW